MENKDFNYNNYLIHRQGYSNRIPMSYDTREPWEHRRDSHEKALYDFIDDEGHEGKIEAIAYAILKAHNHPFLKKIKLL